MGIIIRQSIKSSIVNYVGAFIGFLTTMFLITAILKPEEIGLTKVILEVALLIASLAQLGTSASAMRFFPYFRDPDKQHNGFFFYLVVLPIIGLAIFLFLYLLLQEPICMFFAKNSSLFMNYYNWVIPLVIFITYWCVFETYSNLLMRIVVPKLIREVFVRVAMVVIYLLYAYHYISLNGLVGGMIVVYGMSMVLTLLYVSKITPLSLRHDVSFITPSLRTKIIKYTLYIIVGVIGGGIINKLDIFMVSSKMGLSYAGIYTIAFYIATVIEIPSRSITAISSPVVAMVLQKNDLQAANQLYQKVALHQLLAGSFIFVMIWINIDNIFAIIPNGDIYKEGKWVVFFIALAKLIEITLGFGSTLISFSKYYYWGLYFTFFITALTITSNMLLIPVLGMTGAAIATFLTCIIAYSIQQWLVMVKIQGNPYTIGILKQVGLVLLLFAIDYLLPFIYNPWVDSIYRTIGVVVTGLLLVYLLRISEEVNRLVDNFLRKFKKTR